jgi:hypothetical protein
MTFSQGKIEIWCHLYLHCSNTRLRFEPYGRVWVGIGLHIYTVVKTWYMYILFSFTVTVWFDFWFDFTSLALNNEKIVQPRHTSTGSQNDKPCKAAWICFSDLSINRTIGGVLNGGIESTQTSMRWLILYFLHYPEIQRKCFEQINDMLGTEKRPSWDMRDKLAYVVATICEVLRHANIGAFI